MSKIKVTVNSISQANEIIEYWSDKEVELYIEVKENTTDENSDVVIGEHLLREDSSGYIGIKHIRLDELHFDERAKSWALRTLENIDLSNSTPERLEAAAKIAKLLID